MEIDEMIRKKRRDDSTEYDVGNWEICVVQERLLSTISSSSRCNIDMHQSKRCRLFSRVEYWFFISKKERNMKVIIFLSSYQLLLRWSVFRLMYSCILLRSRSLPDVCRCSRTLTTVQYDATVIQSLISDTTRTCSTQRRTHMSDTDRHMNRVQKITGHIHVSVSASCERLTFCGFISFSESVSESRFRDLAAVESLSEYHFYTSYCLQNPCKYLLWCMHLMSSTWMCVHT